MKTMILDGSSKVGSAKVYTTDKEMKQEKRIKELESALLKADSGLDLYCSYTNGCAYDDESGTHLSELDVYRIAVGISREIAPIIKGIEK